MLHLWLSMITVALILILVAGDSPIVPAMLFYRPPPVGGTAPPPPGYGGTGGSPSWGGGPGPTGLTNAPGVAAKPGFFATNINQSFYVILAATGVPQQAPNLFVPPGATVTIRAHNGTNTGNANFVRVAHQPEILTGIGGDPITPDSEITWPADQTGQIWVVGTAADGINVKIQATRL